MNECLRKHSAPHVRQVCKPPLQWFSHKFIQRVTNRQQTSHLHKPLPSQPYAEYILLYTAELKILVYEFRAISGYLLKGCSPICLACLLHCLPDREAWHSWQETSLFVVSCHVPKEETDHRSHVTWSKITQSLWLHYILTNKLHENYNNNTKNQILPQMHIY